MNAETLIVVPAYNEAESLPILLDNLKKFRATILVVDDGSRDDTFNVAQKKKVRVIRHPVNTGLGSALSTGFKIAKKEGFKYLITIDGDGQHNPQDLVKIIRKLGEGTDVVVGVRSINREKMPFIKKIGNLVLNAATRLFFGVHSKDSQSGLRGFNEIAIKKINITSPRYEASSEILFEAKKAGLKIREVDVEAIYTPHSMKKETGIVDGMKIFVKMILHKVIR
ncbi:MAG: glycosyltransferase [Candidatus Altiarchaeales archaeon]|nr:glycosyltransferase [Candidatus Altiarchaeales archaeon]